MCKGVAPQFMPVRQQSVKIFLHKHESGRAFLPHQTSGSVISTVKAELLENRSPGKQRRSGKVVEGEGDNGRLAVDIYQPPTKCVSTVPEIGISGPLP